MPDLKAALIVLRQTLATALGTTENLDAARGVGGMRS